MQRYFVRRWFLLALIAVLVGGTSFSRILEPLAEIPALRYGIVAVVLFLMALPLQAQAMWQALKRPGPPLLAMAVTFGLLPLLAWGVSFVLSEPLANGLLVAAATPCTLASASVWTRRAGGDDSVAILVTIITNLVCFLVTPLWLVAMTGRDVQIPVGDMIQKLGLLVVLPMTFAQLLRLAGPVGVWATRRKIPLGVLAQTGILGMIFIGSIQTGQRLRSTTQEALAIFDLLLMVGAVMFVHLSMLFTGIGLARLLRFRREDQIAVGFAGSQKTLMVGLTVAMEIGASILPMVAYHVGQLFVDTIIADWLRRRSSTSEPALRTSELGQPPNRSS